MNNHATIKRTVKKSSTEILIMVAILSFLVVLYFFRDARNSLFFPGCIFYSLTGLYCPGCGSQRAFSSLLHGNFPQAVAFNFLFIACLLFALYSFSAVVLNVFRERRLKQYIFYSPLFLKIFFGAAIIFWIARNLSFYPFTLLAPHTIN